MQLCALVAARLTAHGWSADENGYATGVGIAKKTFQTAVGPKEAAVYITRSAEGDPTRTLQGTYYSEGNNVMPCASLFKSWTKDQVEMAVDQFAADADRSVRASYAAGLLEMGVGA
jgi:hypothetical protein